jgi:regulator of CtrA degradation
MSTQSFWVSPSGICPLCLTPPCLNSKPRFYAAFFLASNLLTCNPTLQLDDCRISRHGRYGENFKFVRKGMLSMRDHQAMTSGAIDFLAKFTDSEQFEKTFKEGMGLVEETANYLDGDGRVDARVLDRTGAIAYATESMRLTTRLMQMASWLLLQRAIASGEMNQDEALREKHRINLAEIGRGHDLKGGEQTPDGLKSLVDRSLRLLERIKTLDSMLRREPATNDDMPMSPINAQLNMLERAFKVG